MLTIGTLISDGFILKPYPDGNFWLLRCNDEIFMQVDECLSNITLCDNGWVEDNLTYEEYKSTVQQFKEMQVE